MHIGISSTTQINQYQITVPTTTSGQVTTFNGTAYVNAVTTTYPGSSSTVSGGWYTLVFKVVPHEAVGQYERLIDSNSVKNDLKYFIQSRR